MSNQVDPPDDKPSDSKPETLESSKEVKLVFIGAIDEGGSLNGAFRGPNVAFLVMRDTSGTNFSITYSSGSYSDATIKDLQSKPGFESEGEKYDTYFRKLGKEILGSFFKTIKRTPKWMMVKLESKEMIEKQEEKPGVQKSEEAAAKPEQVLDNQVAKEGSENQDVEV